MPIQATPAKLVALDPSPRETDLIRDAIASRAQRMDASYPRACDLEAQLLGAMHGELRGVASQLRAGS